MKIVKETNLNIYPSEMKVAKLMNNSTISSNFIAPIFAQIFPQALLMRMLFWIKR